MKNITAGYETALAGEVTQIATCWRCERRDGQVFGFTDHDNPLIFDGLEYEASSGYTATAVKDSDTLAVDNLDVEGVFKSDRITDDDLLAGLWDYAEVRIFEVVWSDLSLGALKVRKGRMGNVTMGKLSFNAELRGLMQNLQQEVGRLYGVACDADLGDSRCGVDLDALMVTGSVVYRNDNRVLFDTSRTEADGYFDYGLLTWTSGNNAGLSMEVKRYIQVNGLIELALPMFYDVFSTDTFELRPGCNKAFSTCIAKFDNADSFRGFPHIPGPSKMISGG